MFSQFRCADLSSRLVEEFSSVFFVVGCKRCVFSPQLKVACLYPPLMRGFRAHIFQKSSKT